MIVKCHFLASRPRRRSDEPVVQNGLALTPSEMLDLTRKGFSITSQNLRMLQSADPADKDFYVPLQYRRGMDISDLSNYQWDVRNKLRDAVSKYDKGEIKDVRNTQKHES